MATTPVHIGTFEVLATLPPDEAGDVFLVREGGAAGYDALSTLVWLAPRLAEDASFRARFVAHAERAKRASSEAVSVPTAVGEHEGRPFVVHRHVHGVTLRQALAGLHINGRRLAPEVACALTVQVAEALDGVHDTPDENGQPLELVHGAITSDRLLITFDGRICLTGFGVLRDLARPAADDARTIDARRYAAPEVLRGDEADTRADVFALGALLWEAITMHRYVPSDAAPKPPSTFVPDGPAALDLVVLQSLESEPDRRPLTLDELVHLLTLGVQVAHRVKLDQVGRMASVVVGPELERGRVRLSPDVAAAFDRARPPLDPSALDQLTVPLVPGTPRDFIEDLTRWARPAVGPRVSAPPPRAAKARSMPPADKPTDYARPAPEGAAMVAAAGPAPTLEGAPANQRASVPPPPRAKSPGTGNLPRPAAAPKAPLPATSTAAKAPLAGTSTSAKAPLPTPSTLAKAPLPGTSTSAKAPLPTPGASAGVKPAPAAPRASVGGPVQAGAPGAAPRVPKKTLVGVLGQIPEPSSAPSPTSTPTPAEPPVAPDAAAAAAPAPAPAVVEAVTPQPVVAVAAPPKAVKVAPTLAAGKPSAPKPPPGRMPAPARVAAPVAAAAPTAEAAPNPAGADVPTGSGEAAARAPSLPPPPPRPSSIPPPIPRPASIPPPSAGAEESPFGVAPSAADPFGRSAPPPRPDAAAAESPVVVPPPAAVPDWHDDDDDGAQPLDAAALDPRARAAPSAAALVANPAVAPNVPVATTALPQEPASGGSGRRWAVPLLLGFVLVVGLGVGGYVMFGRRSADDALASGRTGAPTAGGVAPIGAVGAPPAVAVAAVADSGADTGVDSGVDAGIDAGLDAGADAGLDAGFDAGFDAGAEPVPMVAAAEPPPATTPTTSRRSRSSASSSMAAPPPASTASSAPAMASAPASSPPPASAMTTAAPAMTSTMAAADDDDLSFRERRRLRREARRADD